jgi:hypothetical protein
MHHGLNSSGDDILALVDVVGVSCTPNENLFLASNLWPHCRAVELIEDESLNAVHTLDSRDPFVMGTNFMATFMYSTQFTSSTYLNLC